MADKITVKVEGLTHVRDLLIKHIPAKARERVLVAAMRRSFKPVADLAKSKVVKVSGSLALGMSTWKVSQKKKKKKVDTFGSIEIGVKRSNKKALGTYLSFYSPNAISPEKLRKGVYHAHFVEYGIPGYGIPARPFLRPALDSQGQAGIQNFAKELRIGIEKEAKKQAQRQRKGVK